MFLLVSVRHVGAHPDELQDLHTKLYKFRWKISSNISYTNFSFDPNLGEDLCIFTFFHFPDFGLYLSNGFDFSFDLFWMAWHWKPAIQTSIQKVQNVFLETLPAKPMITSCKNRFFRRQKTYYATEVVIRWVNKLLVMTTRNRTAFWYFRHCRWSQPRPQGLLVFQYGDSRRDALMLRSGPGGCLWDWITGYFLITTNNSS